jgi:L-asparaginase II
VTHPAPAVLATYTRSGFTEGCHVGHAVVVDPDGQVTAQWGDADHQVFPRSSNKPAQAAAMVRHGLDLPDHLLALASSSHAGERFHLAGVRHILELAGLGEDALQTPADFPLDPRERDAWISDGRRAAPIAMNCSGKHAAMLLTCKVNGWPTESYLDPAHALQQSIRWQLEALAGEPVQHVGVDGCGAPVMSLSLTGIARSLSRCVLGEPESPGRRVVSAMIAFPDFVGGGQRDSTALMRSVPGLVAKEGAEGVFVAALADGRAVAIKVEDGSDRARQVAMASILVGLGVPRAGLAALLTIPVQGGGGVVGSVSAAV